MIDYTRQLAGLLQLSHWRIDLDPTLPPDDALAQIRCVSGQQRALIQIGTGFHALSLADQRSTIVHELVHIFLWPATEVIEHTLPILGTVAGQMVEAAHDLAIERATDALAVAIADWLPLPKKEAR